MFKACLSVLKKVIQKIKDWIFKAEDNCYYFQCSNCSAIFKEYAKKEYSFIPKTTPLGTCERVPCKLCGRGVVFRISIR